MVDAAEGMLGIEWIDGTSVRNLLPGGAKEEYADDDRGNDEDPLKNFCVSVGEHVFNFDKILVPISPFLQTR
jgi:TP53 regulating kinase-like protein